jgi:hypothetical protein
VGIGASVFVAVADRTGDGSTGSGSAQQSHAGYSFASRTCGLTGIAVAGRGRGTVALLDRVPRIALLVGCAEGLTVSGRLILSVRQARRSSHQDSDGDNLQVRLRHDRSSPVYGDRTRVQTNRFLTLTQINAGRPTLRTL